MTTQHTITDTSKSTPTSKRAIRMRDRRRGHAALDDDEDGTVVSSRCPTVNCTHVTNP
jgi:hypothetical protein